jgi:hypothetical protein
MSKNDLPPKTLRCGGCNRCTVGQPKKFGQDGDCGLCWAWYHSPGHRELWGGDPSEATFVDQPNPPLPYSLTRPSAFPPVHTMRDTCRHFGPSTGEMCDCVEGCKGVKLKVFQCGVYGKCTVAKHCDEDKAKGCCRGCPSYEPIPSDPPAPTAPTMVENYRPLKWSYGVTTVPERRDNLLRDTLSSLQKAGWDKPRLFIDGERRPYDETTWTHHPTTCHDTPLRTFGNWALGLWELYVREPTADRYAIFQDDMVCCRNLRSYLDACPYPEHGYLNLLTFLTNEVVIDGKPVGWYQAGRLECSDPNSQLQTGRGAVALVFNRDAVVTLLSSRHFVERPMEPFRGHRSIDGGIVTSMNKAGYREYIHNPSLVQHVGHISSMGNMPYPQAQTFPGEDFDAVSLLKETNKV